MSDDQTSPPPKRGSRRARVDAAAAGPAVPPVEEASLPVQAAEVSQETGRSGPAPAASVPAEGRAAAEKSAVLAAASVVRPATLRRGEPIVTQRAGWFGGLGQGRLSYGLPLASVAVAAALGWGVGAIGSPGPAPAPAASAAVVQALSEELLRLQGDLRSFKGGVEAVREGLDRHRQDVAHRLQQWGERLDAAPQPDRELGPRLAALDQRLARLEAAEREPSARIAAIVERLDRAEKQLAARHAAAAPSPQAAPPAAPAPEQTGSLGDSRPKPTLDRWALREVYNGVALVEGPKGGLIEVSPGQALPGLGRVEAIERRGKAWVVVTNRGTITAQPW